jgi:alpha-acetolactate decarboxylase
MAKITKTTNKTTTSSTSKKYLLVDDDGGHFGIGTLDEIMGELANNGLYENSDVEGWLLYELTNGKSIQLTKPKIIIK